MVVYGRRFLGFMSVLFRNDIQIEHNKKGTNYSTRREVFERRCPLPPLAQSECGVTSVTFIKLAVVLGVSLIHAVEEGPCKCL